MESMDVRLNLIMEMTMRDSSEEKTVEISLACGSCGKSYFDCDRASRARWRGLDMITKRILLLCGSCVWLLASGGGPNIPGI